MKISVFGLGYVGAVSAGCLAAEGRHVIGVDPVLAKVELINSGASPIVEKDIGKLISETVGDGRLKATTDAKAAVDESDLSFVCVGTPSQANGNLDLGYVRQVCAEIGQALRSKSVFHVVVVRSTMLPGAMSETVIPELERHSEKTAGAGFGVCYNPEFLREGTAVHDFHNPPKTVIGESDRKSGDILASIYSKLDAPLVRTEIATAEMVKYTDNAWHALKVCFANEIGAVCKETGLDGREVMDIFCKDTKLNLSPYYLKPGFAFGGSCLPKDVRALTYKAKTLDLDSPVLNAILPSNRGQIQRGLDMIMRRNSRKVGFLGFSFKAGTDDLRESPIVEVIERLLGKGYDLRLYDRNVNLAKLVGANRNYIMNLIPHISRIMVDSMEQVISHSDIVVVGNNDPEFAKAPGQLSDGQTLIDFVRIADLRSGDGRYEGICW